MGRRPLLPDPAVLEVVTDALRAGSTHADAAEYAGIGESTHWSWLSRGEKEQTRLDASPRAKPKPAEAPYLEYLEAVKMARAEIKTRAITMVANAMGDHWQAAAWFLERSDPRSWAPPRVRLELGTDRDRPVEVTVTHRDALADELAALADRIAPLPIGETGSTNPSPLEEVFDLVPATQPHPPGPNDPSA